VCNNKTNLPVTERNEILVRNVPDLTLDRKSAALYLSLSLFTFEQSFFSTSRSFSVHKLKRVSHPIDPKCLGANGPSSEGEGSTRSGARVGSRLAGACNMLIWCSLSEISAACSKFGPGMQVEEKLVKRRVCTQERCVRPIGRVQCAHPMSCSFFS
jgi:hypothetical protein